MSQSQDERQANMRAALDALGPEPTAEPQATPPAPKRNSFPVHPIPTQFNLAYLTTQQRAKVRRAREQT